MGRLVFNIHKIYKMSSFGTCGRMKDSADVYGEGKPMGIIVAVLGSYALYIIGSALYRTITGDYPWPVAQSSIGLMVWLALFVILGIAIGIGNYIRSKNKKE